MPLPNSDDDEGPPPPMTRKSPAEYLTQLRSIARERGGRLLSRSYLGDATRLQWRCAAGHDFQQRPTSVKQGKWCRLCGRALAGAKKKAPTEARLKELVAAHGGAILTDRYRDSTTPMRFRCAKDHEWAAPPANVLNGFWCRQCSNKRRYATARSRVIERLQEIARRHGGEVMRAETGNRHTLYDFRCARGHYWRSLAATVDRGGWCQECVPDTYLGRVRKIAQQHGGELLSEKYENEDTTMSYRCAAGHVFEQRAGDTVGGSWCLQCSIVRRAERSKAPARARLYRIVTERGGSVLSPAYVNSQTRMRFRCARGHEWETVPGSILMGSWCLECLKIERALHPEIRVGKTEKVAKEVKDRFERAVRKRGGEILPPGFISFKRDLSLRCAHGHTWTAPPQSIQDGMWCPNCRAESMLAGLRELAQRRGGECLSEQCRTVRDSMVWRCQVGHRFSRTITEVRRGGWCPTCRSLPPGDIDRMKQIARERDGECLSERYRDAATKLRWRCEAGHVWSASPGDIVMGHWCPKCRFQSPHSRARLSIDDMRLTAERRGGECVSETYHGSKVRLRWRCARGHTWMAHPNRVRQGCWCPVCSHAARGTLAGMQALAVERGGRCLSTSWNDHSEALHFECGRGHRFHLPGNVVKTGVWCSRCASGSRVLA